MKKYNFVLIMTLALAVGLLGLLAIQNVSADPTISTDKPDYAPEEIVTIHGTGFTSNAPIIVSVTRPDGITH